MVSKNCLVTGPSLCAKLSVPGGWVNDYYGGLGVVQPGGYIGLGI